MPHRMKDVVVKGCKWRIASWAGLRTAGLEMGYKMVGWVVARTDLSFDALQADHGGKLQRWHEFTEGRRFGELASWRTGKCKMKRKRQGGSQGKARSVIRGSKDRRCRYQACCTCDGQVPKNHRCQFRCLPRYLGVGGKRPPSL